MKRKGFAPQKKQSDLSDMRPIEQSVAHPVEDHSETEVAVTILLAGGQQYSVAVTPDDSLLQDLYQTLMNESGSIKKLFQISLNRGQAMLAFHSSQLVGVITEPPLLIEQNQAEAQAPLSADTHNLPSVTGSLVSEYWQIDSFLSAEEH